MTKRSADTPADIAAMITSLFLHHTSHAILSSLVRVATPKQMEPTPKTIGFYLPKNLLKPTPKIHPKLNPIQFLVSVITKYFIMA